MYLDFSEAIEIVIVFLIPFLLFLFYTKKFFHKNFLLYVLSYFYFGLILYFIFYNYIYLNFSYNYFSFQLIPFSTILLYFGDYSEYFNLVFINIYFNLFLLFPLGFLLPFYLQNFSFKKFLIFWFVFCIWKEFFQIILYFIFLAKIKVVFDVDDIFLNYIWLILGYLFYIFVIRIIKFLKNNNFILTK